MGGPPWTRPPTATTVTESNMPLENPGTSVTHQHTNDPKRDWPTRLDQSWHQSESRETTGFRHPDRAARSEYAMRSRFEVNLPTYASQRPRSARSSTTPAAAEDASTP